MLKKILIGAAIFIVVVVGFVAFSGDEYDKFAKDHNMTREELCDIATDNGLTVDNYMEMVNEGHGNELLTLDELKEFSKKYNISIEDIRLLCDEQNIYVSDFVVGYAQHRDAMDK